MQSHNFKWNYFIPSNVWLYNKVVKMHNTVHHAKCDSMTLKKKVAHEACFEKGDASILSDDKCTQIVTAE